MSETTLAREWIGRRWPPRVQRHPTETRSRGTSTLLLRKDGCGWLVVNPPGLRAFLALSEDEHGEPPTSGLLPRSDWAEYLALLHRHGLVSIDGLAPADGRAEPCDPRELDLRLIVVRVTHRCNLRCTYCYAGAGESGHRFSRRGIVRSMGALLPYAGREVVVQFSGGEALLHPGRLTGLIEDVRDMARGMGKAVRWVLQTNATLLAAERISLISDYDVAVGVSLDGPAEVHDAQRVTRNGKGTFARVVRGIEALVRAGVAPTALVTLTKRSTGRLAETLLMLQQLGVKSAGTCHLSPMGSARRMRSEVPTGREVFESFRDVLDLVEAGKIRGMRFSDLLYFFGVLATDQRWYMCLRSPCGAARNMVSVDCNGHLFPCDSFVDEPSFDLGRVGPGFPSVLFEGKASQVRDRNVDGIPRCSTCAWKGYCAGTCPADAFASCGSLRGVHQQTCEFRKLAFEELMWRLAKGGALRDYCEKHFGREFLCLA